MADLAALKADLKSWEKTFKADNGREPKREDIKLVPEIAEKYKIYNRSRKPPLSSAPSTTTAPSSSKQQPPAPLAPSKPSASKPKPATRRSPSPPPSAHSTHSTPSKPAHSSSASTPSSKRLSPSKAPSFNPFLAGPTPATPSSSGSKLSQSPSKRSTPSGSSSSFHYVNGTSPSKLLSLISSHSSKGAPNDAVSLRGSPGWTPRTKARKRLRGEDVGAETPDKKPRKKSWGRGASLDTGGIEEEESMGEQDGDNDEMLGPSPVKEEDKGVREWFGKRRASAAESSDEDEEGGEGLPKLPLPPRRKSSLASAMEQGKGLALAKKNVAFFGTGKMVDLPSSKPVALDASLSSSSSQRASSSSTSNPFLFNSTPTWSASSSGDPSKSNSDARKDGGSNDDSRPSSSPPEPKAKPEKKKNARKAGPIGARMDAAKRAKAETALQTLRGIIGDDWNDEDEDEDGDGEERGMGLGVEAGVKIVRGSHLLRKRGEEEEVRRMRREKRARKEAMEIEDTGRKGKEKERSRKIVFGSDEEEVEEEGMGGVNEQLDADASDAWDSQDDLEDAFVGSPAKVKKQKTLYGLPDEHASESEPSGSHRDEEDEDDDNEAQLPQDVDPSAFASTYEPPPRRSMISSSTIDLPPHLLSLLSLRSPESQAAKLHQKRARTFQGIFAAPPLPSTQPPPPLAPPKHKSSKGKEKVTVLGAVSLPPIKPRSAGFGKKKVFGEVWGVGEEVQVGIDEEGDDDWASEVEGWKEGGGGLEREEEDW